MGGKHQLFPEAQKIHRGGTLLAVEGTERLNLFRLRDQPIAQGNHAGDVLGAVLTALLQNLCDFLVAHERRAVADLRQVVANLRIRVVAQEVRQFHDVAVRIVERTAGGCVGHGLTS